MSVALESREQSASVLRRTLVGIGWCGLGILALVAILSDFLAHAPAGSSLSGIWLAQSMPPSAVHPLGTDLLARDVLSETLHGLRVSFFDACKAVLAALAAGGAAGAACARLPRFAGATLRWAMGVFAAIPALLLAILFIGLTSRTLAPLAAGLAAAPLVFVRAYDRADSLSRSTQAGYARATGISAMALLRRDLMYEFRTGLPALAARAFAAVTIILSTVSFLGFGTVPPARDLGLMIAAARASYFAAWWTAAFPALALLLLILCARLAAGLEEGERP
jgi:peptide/nickel transport system permease protein